MSINTKKIRILLTGGGTGGHIYPAIAVIQKLKNDPDIEKIYYIGCPYNMEKNIVEKEGIEFLPIKISGMPRKLSPSIFNWYLELNRAVQKSISYLLKEKPDVVLGTGGYVSGAVLLACTILRVPFVIHDPDAHPGIVNRFMSPWAKAVTVSFSEAKRFLNSKNIIVNGNPIRISYNNTNKSEARKLLELKPDKKTLLVIGGSQGAKTINEAMLNSVQSLINEHNIQIIHQTGKKNYEEYTGQLSKIWPDYTKFSEYIVQPYFDNIIIPLAAADLAVSRAGSLSISELNINKLPSILVPYPYAAADHQRYNAKAMEKAGASVYLEDKNCNSNDLRDIILNLLNDHAKILLMQKANQELAKPEATDNLINILKSVIRK